MSLQNVQNENTAEEEDGTEPMPCSRELREEAPVDQLGQSSLDACYLSLASGQDFFDTHWAPDSPAFETDDIWAAWEMEKNLHDSKDEEGQEPAVPRKYRVLIQDQARELTQLRRKFREGRDASSCLTQHLEDPLTQEDSDNSQEGLAEGRRLAERLTRAISPGKEDTGPDHTQSQAQERLQTSTGDTGHSLVLSRHIWGRDKLRTAWLGRWDKGTGWRPGWKDRRQLVRVESSGRRVSQAVSPVPPLTPREQVSGFSFLEFCFFFCKTVAKPCTVAVAMQSGNMYSCIPTGKSCR
nr:uncharacterized protein LOC105856503 isoform X4 [Microcebus murinus]XP_012593768.1 uncharacterized protein LOC105856503 isoform X4 [Microcebus murinus]XP_012593769.1 uncharacterized protein LOC105856503 isoform X4 [Microcebus murinus]XP_012593770.1 uncharacterized protein LOC105856503 isoform X4 [Microcebus murinus]XP_012593771.1 uncharacterized protein LOC105856503 isoform X4 [Microcebus murinus]